QAVANARKILERKSARVNGQVGKLEGFKEEIEKRLAAIRKGYEAKTKEVEDESAKSDEELAGLRQQVSRLKQELDRAQAELEDCEKDLAAARELNARKETADDVLTKKVRSEAHYQAIKATLDSKRSLYDIAVRDHGP